MLKAYTVLPPAFSIAISSSPAEKENKPKKKQKSVKAQFVDDVDYPDGTMCVGGSEVKKTWSMRNSGTVPWPAGTVLKYTHGSLAKPLATHVPLAKVGQTVDVTATVRLPTFPGRYNAYFTLERPTKKGMKTFGPNIWTDLSVAAPSATPLPTPMPTPTPTPAFLAAAVPAAAAKKAEEKSPATAKPAAAAAPASASAGANPPAPVPVAAAAAAEPKVDASKPAPAKLTVASLTAPAPYAAEIAALRAMGIQNPDEELAALLKQYDSKNYREKRFNRLDWVIHQLFSK
jgi:hypothetical protein